MLARFLIAIEDRQLGEPLLRAFLAPGEKRMDQIDVALADYRCEAGHPFIDEFDPFGLGDLGEAARAEFCIELFNPLAIYRIERPLAPAVQIGVRRARERNGRTDPPEDRVADFLLFLPAELFGRVVAVGDGGQACTLADADARPLICSRPMRWKYPSRSLTASPTGRRAGRRAVAAPRARPPA